VPNKKITAGDIKFEKGMEDAIGELSDKFISKLGQFVASAIPHVAQIAKIDERKVEKATIYDILSVLMKAGSLPHADVLAVRNEAVIKDMKGNERKVYFIVNIAPKHPEDIGGLFNRHHAGGATTGIPDSLSEDEKYQAAEEMGDSFGIKNVKPSDRVISVDMSAKIPFDRFSSERDEARTSIFGVLAHELSHAYDAQSEKENNKYHQIQVKMNATTETLKKLWGVIQDDMTLALMAAINGRSPQEMDGILRAKAQKLQAKHKDLFARYINTPHEMKSALKEFRVFINALSSGQFVEDFKDVRHKFQTSSPDAKKEIIKNLLMSIGTWHHISEHLNEKNKVMVFKFIYRLLTEDIAEEQRNAPDPNIDVEEFEISND